LAERLNACACSDPDGKTFTVEGNLTLNGLTWANGNRMKGALAGSAVAIRLDEALADPALFFPAWEVAAAAVVGATAAGALVVRLLYGFTRVLSPEAALGHPKRRRLYEAVQAHPGAGPKFLHEATGYSLGSVRNHLAALERVGLVVSNRHAGQVHFFKNHGRYSKTWKKVAAQRDRSLRQVVDLLMLHPDRSQQEVVREAEGLGLSRSATQRRLDRLEAWGLVSVQREGRGKRYRLTPSPPLPPPRAEPSASGRA
jgi:DNA-binding transcriptional ArsR family regulator